MTGSNNLAYLSTPKSVSISITGKCNLGCNYCFYANEMVGLKDLGTEQWLEIFKQLKKLKIMDICLTGGEVFTRPDFFHLLDGIIENKMRYSILSNGTLINEKIIGEFSKGKRKKRLDYIQISIDGSTAEIHNMSRPNSFDKALKGLRLLKKQDFPLMVRVTINKHNLGDLENIAELLLQDIGLPSFGTNEAMPIGSGCRSDNEISLDSREQLEAIKIMKKLLKKYPGRLLASAGPQAKLKAFSEMEKARNGNDTTAPWKMGYLSGCGCIFSKIDILHDGTIVPCCMLPGLELGNILHDSLLEIWHNHHILKALRGRRSIPMDQVKGCEPCEWNKYCNGNCPGVAHQLTGELNRANPEDCLKKFLKDNGIKEFINAV